MGLLALVQAALLVVPSDGAPLRFGVPLPAAAVRAGLELAGPGVLQWRRLPIGGDGADPVWVELAIVAPAGEVRVRSPGAPPIPDRRGRAYVHSSALETRCRGEQPLLHAVEVDIERIEWCDGSVDQRERERCRQPVDVDGERFGAGEFVTTRIGDTNCHANAISRLGRGFATRCGLLPPVGRGETTRAVRRRLVQLPPRLPELPGRRGAGDFVRSGGVVTNLEFDTTLALVKLAFAHGDAAVFAAARRAARHTLDIDLDSVTGLPFPHGPEHRTGVPEPGHAWLAGLLWVGLLTADDALLAAARGIALALANHPPMGTGRRERLRDYAWPLLELEAWLEFEADDRLALAADRLSVSVHGRFDAEARTFRFGEGELGGGVYFERGWLTAGLLLPALDAHLRRRPEPRLQAAVAVVREGLLDRITTGGPGLPTHWRVRGAEVFAEHRDSGTAEAAWLLEPFEPRELARLLRRGVVRGAVGDGPALDHPDLATQFTMLARLDWVYR